MKNGTDQPPNIIHAEHNGKEFQFALIQALVDAMPDGILVVDQHGIIVATNERLFELWDISPEEIDGARSRTLVGENDELLLNRVLSQVKNRDIFLQRVQELYANPDADDKTEIELKNGTVLERHSTVLRDHDHEYLGRLWIFSDITGYKRTAENLAHLALSDALTGIANRRHFMRRADEEFARARRYKQSLGFVMFDIDHFKDVNDQHGHAAGDQVLKALARHCTELLRETDFLARTGGEEFVILMPNTGLSEASTSAERLRRHIAQQSIDTDARMLNITISLGVTAVRSSDKTIADTFKRADEALYMAKDSGRNRVYKLK